MKKMFGLLFFGMIGAGTLYLALDAGQIAQISWGLATALAWGICAMIVFHWLIDEIVPRWDEHRIMERHAQAITPDSELVEKFSQLEPHQAEALMQMQARLVAMPGIAGAVLEYDLGADQRVPAEFVRDFIEASSGPTLKPIRSFSEGTKAREWATIVTNWFIARGLARPAAGNASAMWTMSSEVAARWLMVVDDE